MEPTFLSLAEVLEIHRDQIQRYGGDAGIRDMGLLQSAIAMPTAGFGDSYFHADLFAMAAAYVFHIVQNQPFVDGNKRAGAVAAIVFLDLNDAPLDADEKAFELLVMGVADGKVDKAEIAAFFRDRS